MRTNEMQRMPGAEDIAAPSIVYRGPGGETLTMLRPYWREHPDVGPPLPGTQIAIATWRDGTVTPVPKDSDPSTLSAFYCAALAAGQLRELAASLRGRRQ